MISVIIPAHNEAAVIRRGLEHLLAGARPGELEVVVACNGCTDDTAAIARAFGPPVQVLEIATASKIVALNAADAVATAFPRVYLDADVQLSIDSVRALAAALEADPAVPLVAPRLRMDLTNTSWAVRAFYRVWMSLPYNQTMVGTGSYALSRAGRSRLGAFPDVIADDGFVRFQFKPEERSTVPEAEVWVAPPRTLAGLIRVKTRARLGGLQLRRYFPNCPTVDHKSAVDLACSLLRRVSLWPYVPMYVVITILAQLRAKGRARRRDYRWDRDDSARASTYPVAAAREFADLLLCLPAMHYVLTRFGFAAIRYRAFDAAFRRKGWDVSEVSSELVSCVAKYAAGDAVLALGCGTGLLCAHLPNGSYSEFVGVDVSAFAVQRARERKLPRARFVQDDLRHFRCDRKFRLLIFEESLNYVCSARDISALNSACCQLVPGGFCIITIADSARYSDLLNAVRKSYGIVEDRRMGKSARCLLVLRSHTRPDDMTVIDSSDPPSTCSRQEPNDPR